MTLNKHAPMKTKYLRANNSPFMNKELTKAIMVRSRLKNKSLKLKTTEAREAYKKQRNFCVSLLRRNDPVELAIKKYKNHPSIIRIHQEGYSNNKFSFTPISQQDIHDIINNIDSSKAYQKENIPPKILKDNIDMRDDPYF